MSWWNGSGRAWGRDRRAAAVVGLLVLLTGASCGGTAAAEPHRSPPPARGAAGPPPSTFVVVMENRGPDQALAASYIAKLAHQYAMATNYSAVTHPSLPNYLALTAGSTFGIADDEYHVLPRTGIGAQLSDQGISWRAYMDGMTGDCMQTKGTYAVKHNPFAYYGGACPANVVSLAELDGDLTGQMPRFVWISPDLCHDGHDCSILDADTFLQGLVPRITASAAWRAGGLLLITWDEDDSKGDNHVLLIAVAPNVHGRTSAQRYDHYSLLAAVEDRLGVPRLGMAEQADPLTDLLRSGR